ncbi:MAG: alpha/beta fold hydrolase [Acidobacteriota bacterium]
MSEPANLHQEKSTTVRKVHAYPKQRSTPITYLARTTLRTTGRIVSALSPAIAGRLAAPMFLTPPRPKRPAWEDERLATARPWRLTLANGRSVAAWRWLGDGPTVVLVHGWGGRGSQLSAMAAPLVEAGFSVVAFDAPGHGDSDGRRSSLVAMSSALHAVAAASAPLAGVVAHSAGATATAMVLANGLDIPRIVFVGPGVEPVTFTHAFADHLGLSEPARRSMQERIERHVGIRLDEIDPLALAPDFDIPLLTFHDHEDRETPFDGAQRLTAAWPDAELRPTRGLGHRRILRDNTVVAQTVRFFARASRSRRPAA